MNIDPGLLSIAEDACGALREVLKQNLRSCVLYGSAVRGTPLSRQSDVNLLIVLEHSSPEAHQAIAECLRRHPRVSPFVLTWSELPRSRRVFAIKFRSIQRHGRILFGDDPFAGFEPDPALLRFLCEQSLRNLRLRLKHAFITMGHERRRYGHYLVRTTSPVFVTLSEVLRSAGIDVPNDYKDRPEIIAREFGCDASVLADLLALKREPRSLSDRDVFSFHSRLFRLLSAALTWVEERWPQTPEAI